MDYYDKLKEQFKDLKLEIVNFDNGATTESMAAYILVSGLTKTMLKDKGSTALDLSNYLYHWYGLMFETCPEYHRSGEPKNSLAFYISKGTMDRQPRLKEFIIESYNEKHEENPVKRYESALYFGRRFLIY